MNTYTVTTKSTLYTVYEVEAGTEAEAKEIVDTAPFIESLNEWSEDTQVDSIELASDDDIDVWGAFSTYPEEPNITSLAIDDSEYL